MNVRTGIAIPGQGQRRLAHVRKSDAPFYLTVDEVTLDYADEAERRRVAEILSDCGQSVTLWGQR